MYGKMADTLPIPKFHPPKIVQTDLRPILLTPTVSWQLKSIVGEWILLHTRDQLDLCQYGSLNGSLTAHALIDMLHHWSSALDNGMAARVLFVDFAKASDHVDHITVLQQFIID